MKAGDDAVTRGSQGNRKEISQANQLPTAIAKGSQEAYKLMVANSNRATITKDSEAAKQTAVNKLQLDVAKESKAILAKLSEQLDFETVGS